MAVDGCALLVAVSAAFASTSSSAAALLLLLLAPLNYSFGTGGTSFVVEQ